MNTPTQQTAIEIRKVCDSVADMLIKKNESYGDSALSPLRCFSRLDPEEGLRVRIDDKISRLICGDRRFNEDTEMDLMGYLILLRVARLRSGMTAPITRTSEEEEDPMVHHI